MTKIASGVGDDGLPFVDYTAAGEASASGVIQLYLSSMSRAAFAAGQTWTVSILAQIIAGTVPTATGTGVRLEINGETTAGIFLQNISSVSHRPTTETVVSHTATLTAAGIQQTRCGVALRTDAGVSVNYTIRIKALQFELGTARTNGRLRELSPADVHSVIADGGVLPLGALGLTGALAAAGWQRLPSGLIFQWGRTASTGSSVAITFPIAFPNACFQGFATPFYNTSFAGTGVLGAYFQATSAAGATITNDQSGSVSATAVQWLAIGN
ncbi:MAG: gp53-like domain-containing protein [Cypionkella sp.]